MLTGEFFARDPLDVAKDLLGKVLRHYCHGTWLSAMIIETEAYYLWDKGSHASLGFTEKRKALFMEPGTIYMYYARGADSINVSCLGPGNAVLLKSGIPFTQGNNQTMIETMQRLNPIKNSTQMRDIEKLCSGQTLLCRALGLKVTDWDQKHFVSDTLRIDDVGIKPSKIIQATRLGIPSGRDEHLPFRFVYYEYAKYCTRNPVTQLQTRCDVDYAKPS
jgi:DNA-3-methyladenine glycosylase